MKYKFLKNVKIGRNVTDFEVIKAGVDYDEVIEYKKNDEIELSKNHPLLLAIPSLLSSIKDNGTPR